jgi:hypothetical protein
VKQILQNLKTGATEIADVPQIPSDESKERHHFWAGYGASCTELRVFSILRLPKAKKGYTK